MPPKLTVLHQTQDSIEFKLEDVSRHFSNALRRIIIAEVPTLAIDLVDVRLNTSPLPDDYVCHRLGLIPFSSEVVDSFNYPDLCSCISGCEKCTVYYTINVKCPANENYYIVTNEDLRIFNFQQSDFFDTHLLVKPAVTTPVPIVKLARGQELKVICQLKKGLGRTHSKWSPVCVSAYHQIADINIDHSIMRHLSQSQRDRIINSCPSKVYRHDITNEKIEVDDAHRCTFCNYCLHELDEMKSKQAISIESKRNVFIFNIEVVGQLSPKSVVEMALKSLKKKLETFDQNVKAASENS